MACPNVVLTDIITYDEGGINEALSFVGTTGVEK